MSVRRPIALLAFVASLATARADVVTHSNGQRIEGVVISEDDQRVVVRLAGGQVALAKSSIVSIERGDAAQNALLDLRAALRTGSMADGIAALIAAREAGAPADQLDARFVEFGTSLVATAKALPLKERSAALLQLNRLETADFLSPQAHLIVARLYLEMEDGLKASDALARAGLDAIEDDDGRLWARDMLKTLVRRLVLEGRYQEAVEQIERLELLDGGAAAQQRPIMHLAAAARARNERDWSRALSVIADDLWPAAPEIARNRALVVLRLATEWAAANHRENEARTWINATVARRMPVESLSAAHELYASEAEYLLRNQRPEQALRLLDQLTEEERPERLQLLRARAWFESERLRIGQSDPVTLFERAQEAAEAGLETEALETLRELRANDLLREAADRQASLIKQRRDLVVLEKALAAYDAGLMTDVVDLCNTIDLDDGRESPNLQQIRDLAELARGELARAEEAKPYQAEVFFQQGERAYFMNDPDGAWKMIDLVLAKFPGTPAAQRAAALLPDIVQLFEIQLLEGERLSVPKFDSAMSESELRKSNRMDKEIRTMLEAL